MSDNNIYNLDGATTSSSLSSDMTISSGNSSAITLGTSGQYLSGNGMWVYPNTVISYSILKVSNGYILESSGSKWVFTDTAKLFEHIDSIENPPKAIKKKA